MTLVWVLRRKKAVVSYRYRRDEVFENINTLMDNAGARQVTVIYVLLFVVFFFQAEDGIRDYKVTGVQTCALPICGAGFRKLHGANLGATDRHTAIAGKIDDHCEDQRSTSTDVVMGSNGVRQRRREIGRASCRERV